MGNLWKRLLRALRGPQGPLINRFELTLKSGRKVGVDAISPEQAMLHMVACYGNIHWGDPVVKIEQVRGEG